ncbi:MAG: RNase adapter RapZ [Bacilli bacterium]|nr:RNase adapter RapZ [Bacilli bacterium]
MQNIIVLSGLSGAGKSTITHAFEEKGYRMIENIPNLLLPELFEEFKVNPVSYEKVVLIFEVRHAMTAIRTISECSSIPVKTLLLDCSKADLLKRFRLTRHVHPLQTRGLSLEEALDNDRKHLEEVRQFADIVIDTTGMSDADLRQIAFANIEGSSTGRMVVMFSSFGYKYGVPQDAEIVFDCRCLPNPYWVPELKKMTGLDQPVIEFLDRQKECRPYFDKMCDFLDYYLDQCQKSGRNYISIYSACSGGQHRSVYFTEKLFARFSDRYLCLRSHREIGRYLKEG